MSFSTILGGLAGGLAGALIWVLVGYFTGYEVGYIAWGVGFLAGVGLRFFAAKAGLEENAMQGVAAAVIAIACIVVAKGAVIWLHVADMKEKIAEATSSQTISDEQMVMNYADDIVAERTASGKSVKWPPGKSEFDAERKEDYPKDIWSQAEREWKKVPPAEQEQRKSDLIAARKKFADSFADNMFSAAFKDAFGPWDLLWVFLAVGTAYKIGAGTYSNE